MMVARALGFQLWVVRGRYVIVASTTLAYAAATPQECPERATLCRHQSLSAVRPERARCLKSPDTLLIFFKFSSQQSKFWNNTAGA